MYPAEYTWIKNPTPVMINNMIDERGSTRNAMSAEKPAVEIQLIRVTEKNRPSDGALTSCVNKIMEAKKESNTVPQAIYLEVL